MKLKELLDTVYYGTRVRLGLHSTDNTVANFTMSYELEYKKEYEQVEPYLENLVMGIYITSEGKLYIEIL